MIKKHLQLIGLANRAQRCVSGTEAILEYIERSEVKFVIIAKDASSNTKSTIINKCRQKNVPYKIMETRYELGKAVGKNQRIAVALTDEGFASKIQTII